MNTKSTLKVLFTALIATAFNLTLYSQAKTVTICPEGCDYETLVDAFNAVKADAETYPNGSEVIFQLSEGIHQSSTLANLGRLFHPTFQGAGAGKTIIQGAEERISPEVATGRFLNMANATNTGATVVIRDITFRNFGTLGTNMGMIVHAGANAPDLNISLINCHFESVVARNGAVLHSNSASHEVTIDNCFFYDCEGMSNLQKRGIIFKGVGGKITVRNSTFYSNVNNPIDVDSGEDLNFRRAGIIDFGTAAGETMDAVLEGNIFVNNLVVPAGSGNVVQCVMEFTGNIAATNNLTMNDNIFISNFRQGHDKDVDIVLINPNAINITGSGNLVNRIITYTGDPGGEEITHIDHAAFSANMDYNYIHPAIAFTMDGDHPKILVDEFGVNYIGQEPVSVLPPRKDSHFRAYSYHSQVVIEGLRGGDLFEVYTVTGSRFMQGIARDYQTVIELPKGLFILRSGTSAQKVIVR